MSLVCSPLPILLITVVNCGATLCMRTPGDDFFGSSVGPACASMHTIGVYDVSPGATTRYLVSKYGRKWVQKGRVCGQNLERGGRYYTAS